MLRYADIVLPLAQPAYTFELDPSLEVREGDAVAVPFGNNSTHYYTGIVWRIHSTPPNAKRIRRIERRLYPYTLLEAEGRAFWEWVANYYMCSIGEVMRVALPSLMKPSGISHEELELELFKPREEYYVSLSCSGQQLDELKERCQRKAPKQYQALEEIATLCHHHHIDTLPRRLVDSDLLTLKKLETKGAITLTKGDSCCEQMSQALFTLPTLTPHQITAKEQLDNAFKDKTTALLAGITGSGKTEIYIHFIAQSLAQGDDVLLLLPEIALTTQLLERMERIFGSRVVAYHSHLTAQRRTKIYMQLTARTGGNFIIGVRSAIFLPLKRLGLIIVDEEHDPSYKQHDTAPRYNARDGAVAIAAMRNIRTLLGSATPSLESWTNATCGKYGVAHLTERYGSAVPPTVTISDTIRAVKRGERRGHFNIDLLDKIKLRLERREQVILFQNRRGFAPYIECEGCGWSPKCPNCNVTLTLHKGAQRLNCHHCGHIEPPHQSCPECGSAAIKPMGFGTEKIEQQLAELFPQASVARLDRDTATSPQALNRIIKSFESGAVDILVGTQMVTKGFDFGQVTLVGILNADNMLHTPDFRAEERAFQLMMQVAGRSGRREGGGEVVIQTSLPEHRILKLVEESDYDTMARQLLDERRLFAYPPYGRIVVITMRHNHQSTLNQGANALAGALRHIFGRRLQGPVPPPIDRIRGEHIVVMTLKIEAGASSNRAREIVSRQIERLKESSPKSRSITIVCNVDPQ